jgi:predicted metal-dependent hydrolase
VPEVERTPHQALALAQQLLDAGRAFYAHDVLEAAWKAAPSAERALWQGLAQVCVGLTHEQRGNPVGAARLLRRGAGRLREAVPAHGVPTQALADRAELLAEQVEAGRPGDRSLRLR